MRNLERLKLAADLAAYLAPNGPSVIETTLGDKTADWAASKERIADELRLGSARPTAQRDALF